MKKNNYVIMTENNYYEDLDYESAYRKHSALKRLGLESSVYKKVSFGLVKILD